MEFRVLGPVTVHDSGRRVDVGGRKQRTVLALLVAHAGRVVSTDRLVEAAYGDEAPDRARRSVQTYVSNLRARVGDMIQPASSGYELMPGEHSFDHLIFEDLVESGRIQVADDPSGAAHTLRSALALWRGHPYQDVDSRGELDAEITRLNELRLIGLELRVEADLAAGQDRELVGELEALTAEHPFREAFRAHQMLALYRSGRQAEALRVFTRTRELLAEELGIDPSEELRRLEQRMLEQDSTLMATKKVPLSRQAVLVIDLTDGAAVGLDNPDERHKVLAAVDRVVETEVAGAGGAIAGQQATSTYATFADVDSALEAADGIERSAPHASGAPIVRIGLDFGDVAEEPGGVIAGPTVERAAGLVAAAHPGQILLSSQVQGAVNDDWATRDLGDHVIGNLPEAEHIHQLVVEGLPARFPEPLPPTDRPQLPVGLFGVPGYELREEIGRGLSGTVYRGYQPSVGREVAIKVIRPDLVNDPGFIRRFAVEAQMISRLDHPHVVPMYDFWRGPGQALIVMRLMTGGNLADWAEMAGVDRAATIRIVDQIAGALATAHSLGIAHGDVQARNVLLNESGDFFLADFGVVGDVPTQGGGLAQELDVAAFAAMIGGIVDRGALDEVELGILDEARRGGFSNAGELLAMWQRQVGEAVSSPKFTPARNPYKGLAAFSELDAHDFHGRGAETQVLVEAIATRPLVAVVGPSGIGKSSVVRAGLIPALRKGAVPGSEQWIIADCSPGGHPFERLATSLIRVASSVPQNLEDLLREDDRGLIKAVDRYLPRGTQLLLVIDQFEELFTLTVDPDARNWFMDLLTTSASDDTGTVHVVVTIRADFFDRPLRHAEFGELLRAGTVPISAPTDDEFRSIITHPAAGVGVEFESGVVERIVADVSGQTGALPLVEFALTELFDQRKSDLLTVQDYEDAGGVTAALGRRAETIYKSLDKRRRRAARQLFLRLVIPGEGDRDTRRRIRTSELARLGLKAEAVNSVLSAFGSHRLLTFDRDDTTRGSTVEVAHEALLREWPRLAKWIEEHREDLVLHSRLSTSVAEWEIAGRADTYLLSGGRLAQHEAWVEDSELRLSESERELLAASRAAEDDRASIRRRRRHLIMGGFAAAAILAFVLAAYAIGERNAARQATVDALASQALALTESDPALAVAVALEADAISSSAQTQGVILSALDAFTGQTGLRVGVATPFHGPITSLSVASNGVVFASLDNIRGFQGWSLASGALIYDSFDEIHDDPIVDLHATADGRVVTASGDGTAAVWDLESAMPLASFDLHEDDLTAMHVHEASNRAITADKKGVARIWDLSSGEELAVLIPETTAEKLPVVWSASFAPDGSVVATGDANGIVRRWDPVTGQELTAESIHRGSAAALAYSPDGEVLYSGGNDGQVVYLDSTSLDSMGGSLTHGRRVIILAVSPDGSRLLTGTADGEAIVWDVELRERFAITNGHEGTVNAVVFDPSSELAITAGRDGTIQTWGLESSQGAVRIQGHRLEFPSATERVVHSLAFDPSGELLATAGKDGSLRMWDIAAQGQLWRNGGPDDEAMRHVAFSPDGSIVAGADNGGVVWLWDSRTGEERGRFEAQDKARGLAFSPDGAELVVGSLDEFATVWDIASGTQVGQFPPMSGQMRQLALSADGVTMIVPQSDGVATVWDVATRSLRSETLAGPEIEFGQVRYNSDETLIASAAGNGSVEIWDAGTYELIVSLPAHQSIVRSLAFSPDGRFLVTGSGDLTIRIWDTETWEPVGLWRRHIADIWWADYSPDGQWVATASADGTALIRYAGFEHQRICSWLQPYVTEAALTQAVGSEPTVCTGLVDNLAGSFGRDS